MTLSAHVLTCNDKNLSLACHQHWIAARSVRCQMAPNQMIHHKREETSHCLADAGHHVTVLPFSLSAHDNATQVQAAQHTFRAVQDCSMSLHKWHSKHSGCLDMLLKTSLWKCSLTVTSACSDRRYHPQYSPPPEQ